MHSEERNTTLTAQNWTVNIIIVIIIIDIFKVA